MTPAALGTDDFDGDEHADALLEYGRRKYEEHARRRTALRKKGQAIAALIFGLLLILVGWAVLAVTVMSIGGDRYAGYVVLGATAGTGLGLWMITRAVGHLRSGRPGS